MGLDMWLYKREKLNNIQWATEEEAEKKSKYDKNVNITTPSSPYGKTIKLYYINKIFKTNGSIVDVWEIKEIDDTLIVVEYWDETAPQNQKLKETVITKADIDSIEYEYAYWRKDNQIHKWFVDNVQKGNDDCDYYEVEGSKLLELADLCLQVLRKRDENFSKEILPSYEGFFFGGYEYKDYYYEGLSRTLKQLAEVRPNEVYTYTSSW